MSTKKKQKPPQKKRVDFKSQRFTYREFIDKFFPQQPPEKEPYEQGVELARKLVRFAP